MPADRTHHLDVDLLAVAMRELLYSLAAIEAATERAAILQAEGVDWHAANVAAVREVDAWPEHRRRHVPRGVAAPAALAGVA